MLAQEGVARSKDCAALQDGEVHRWKDAVIALHGPAPNGTDRSIRSTPDDQIHIAEGMSRRRSTA